MVGFIWGRAVHAFSRHLFSLSGGAALLAGMVGTTQQRFNDWQVTCNNQNFCVTRNVGLHYGLVMTLSRSAGAVTDASLRIELGGTGNPVATLAPIAPRLLLDGKPLSLTDKHWHIEDKLLKTGDSVTIDAFLQQVQEGKALTLASGLQNVSLQGLKAALFFIDDRQKRVGSETAWVGKGEEPPLSVPPALRCAQWRARKRRSRRWGVKSSTI